MFSSSLEQTAVAVLREYPALRDGCRLLALGNRGGFSGARLWQVHTAHGMFCLRAWPAQGPPPERLRTIHTWMRMAVAAGLEFVPTVLSTIHGTTWTEQAGRLWEVTRWLPGRADFQERPEPARLEAACQALARLHLVWAGLASGPALCPAVGRRLERWQLWTNLLASGWRPSWNARPDDPARPWAERAWRVLHSRIGSIPLLLEPARQRPVLVQPCLCDLWHDHVLFDGATVTGLIDYGAAKVDHVAADLARLLGSLAGDDVMLRAAGLDAYQRLRPLSWEEEALVTVLDQTGTLLGAVNWLLWLYREGREFEDHTAAAQRLAALVQRIEGWQ